MTEAQVGNDKAEAFTYLEYVIGGLQNYGTAATIVPEIRKKFFDTKVISNPRLQAPLLVIEKGVLLGQLYQRFGDVWSNEKIRYVGNALITLEMRFG